MKKGFLGEKKGKTTSENAGRFWGILSKKHKKANIKPKKTKRTRVR